MPSFITSGDVTAWAPGPITDLNPGVMTACCDAASEAVEDYCGAVFSYYSGLVSFFDGDKADGRCKEILYLPSRYLPVNDATCVVIVDGGAPTLVAEGYAPDAPFLIRGAGQDRERCCLIRQRADGLGWEPGVQNVKVLWEAGPAGPPADVKQVAVYLAWQMYKDAGHAGVRVLPRGATWLEDLPKGYLRILDAKRRKF
jgi:hypothetical protein